MEKNNEIVSSGKCAACWRTLHTYAYTRFVDIWVVVKINNLEVSGPLVIVCHKSGLVFVTAGALA